MIAGQPTKVNESHLTDISLVILRHLPAVVFSFRFVSSGCHVEVEVGLGVCATRLML